MRAFFTTTIWATVPTGENEKSGILLRANLALPIARHGFTFVTLIVPGWSDPLAAMAAALLKYNDSLTKRHSSWR